MTVSWKPVVEIGDDSVWTANARFATRDEAYRYVTDLALRWTGVTATRVVEDDRPATHCWRGMLERAG